MGGADMIRTITITARRLIVYLRHPELLRSELQ